MPWKILDPPYVSTAVNGLASVCNITGAVGSPFTGMDGAVLDQGMTLYNLANGGEGGVGGGAGKSIEVQENLSALCTELQF